MMNKVCRYSYRSIHRFITVSKPILPCISYYQHRHHSPQHIGPNLDVQQRNRELAKRCEDVTKTGVYANIGLVILKGSAGYMTNSMALIADATHSFTDLISDFMTYATIKFSQRKPTKKFPLGFGKIDTLGTLPVAGLLTFGSYHIVTTSISKLYSGAAATVITMPQVAMGCVLLSLLIKEWLYRITIKAGNEYQSNVIIANAWHHRSDAYTSMIALIGVGGYFVGLPTMDPICGMIVGFYLFKIGIDFFKMGFEQLLDRNHEIHWKVINGIISKCDGVNQVNDLIVTQSGQYIHITAEIMVDESLKMKNVQQIVNNVKAKLYENDTMNIQHLVIIPITLTIEFIDLNAL